MMGKKGVKVRNENLSEKRRKEIAAKAGRANKGKKRKKKISTGDESTLLT